MMNNSIVLWRPQPDNVYTMDCFDLMRAVPPQSVDAIITDLPYQVTGLEWDTIIPFAPMWEAVKRILKPGGVFVTTATEPFASLLRTSNLSWYRYDWVWDKKYHSNPFLKEHQPLRKTEDVLVFSAGDEYYYPQMNKRPAKWLRNKPSLVGKNGALFGKARKSHANASTREWMYPTNLISLPLDNPNARKTGHPTQKPVDLFRYLIRTYTQPGDLVLDPCVGSGTTALAARAEGRRYIVGDSDPHYCNVARERLRQPYERHYVTKESAPLNELPLFAMEVS